MTNVPRKGSAERSIPHTRINEDDGLKEKYEIGRKLGEGSFGKVYSATSRATGKAWAIKSVNKEKAGSNGLKLLEREVAILKRVKHPNIIQLNEVIESNQKMYLVTEICDGGELNDVLKQSLFKESETKIIMTKLASAISYLHKHDIVHRDLKLENILLSQNPDDPEDKLHIKVTDFGLSVVKDGVGHDNMMQDVCGTPIYMAPEIIDNKTYSQMCDVWAMGVIMYMLLCGYPPFNAADEEGLYEMIKKAEVKFEEPAWKDITEEAKNCIERMLRCDPAHRITAGEVLDHSWITGESHDNSRPTNVLEMMRMFREEEDTTDNLVNGEIEVKLDSEHNDEDVTENGTSSSQTKDTTDRKGSGGKKASSTLASSSSTNTSMKPKHSTGSSNPTGASKISTGSKLHSNNVKHSVNTKTKSTVDTKTKPTVAHKTKKK
ncbi:hypothetical protein SNE40_018860 [Patella caerulea]|uniref:Protein kinase domain-containing protein n=1 Tax=Patella caerulea TaxID=87958 RepID=A0AAN8P8N6_PATCE